MLQVLQRAAEVVEHASIHHLDLTRWRDDSDETRNAVDDRPQFAFARSEPLFGLLAVVDVGEEVVPAIDRAVGPAGGHHMAMKPAIRAVGATDAVLPDE